MQQTELGFQQNYFLQSIKLVENAGKILQKPELSKPDIERSMQQMDEGVKLAFQVDREFLKKLDLRLPKFYQELFIAGIEQYRLGVESSNRQQQLEGLNLLNRWGQFWISEKSNVLLKLEKLNG